MNASSSANACSTPAFAIDFAARFSPDGRFILYDSTVNGNAAIFVVPAEGGAARCVTTDASQNFLPTWNADGSEIYFCSKRSGEYQIWKMPANGGAATQITKHGGFESAPDGREIFYTKARGVTGLWRVGIDGGEESAVQELAEASYWRYWAITRAGIYFVAGTSGSLYRIKFYDFERGQASDRATTDKPPIWIYPGLSVSADGKTILYAQQAQSASSSSIMLAGLEK